MSDWLTSFDDKINVREITNTKTGAIKRIPYASAAQWEYLQTLRTKAGKTPLKNKLPAYKASKAIQKLLDSTKQSTII